MSRRLPRLGPRRWRLPVGATGGLARYAAPAAFLLAVTAVVLVVRSALRSHAPAARTTTAAAATRPAPAPVRPKPPAAPKQWYVIRSGDTLQAIATRFATSVTELLRLNPGVQATSLIPGQQLRVK